MEEDFHISPRSVTSDEVHQDNNSLNRKRPLMETKPEQFDHVKRIPTTVVSDCRANNCLPLCGHVDTQNSILPHSYVKNYASASLCGYNGGKRPKVNQDCHLLFEDKSTNSLVCVCLDGHGIHGHTISQMFKRSILTRLCSHPLYMENVDIAIRDVLATTEYEIFQREARLGDYSGTTMTLAIVRGNVVTIANVGDSRIVLGKRVSPKQLPQQGKAGHSSPTVPSLTQNCIPVPVTLDHKPTVASEYSRVIQNGGRIFSIRYEDGTIGPPRVWLHDVDIPGLAMTRSLGDFVVHTVGVSSVPDIHHFTLSMEEDYCLIAATDGLWDAFSNEEVLQMASLCGTPGQAVEMLISEAQNRLFDRDRQVDDTTVCIINFQRPPANAENSVSSLNGEQTAAEDIPKDINGSLLLTQSPPHCSPCDECHPIDSCHTSTDSLSSCSSTKSLWT